MVSFLLPGPAPVQATLCPDGGSLAVRTTAGHKPTDGHILGFSLEVDASPLVPLLGRHRLPRRTMVRATPFVDIDATGRALHAVIFDVFEAAPAAAWSMVPERRSLFLQRPAGLPGLVVDQIDAWVLTPAALLVLLEASRIVRARFDQLATLDPAEWSTVPAAHPPTPARRAGLLQAAPEARLAGHAQA